MFNARETNNLLTPSPVLKCVASATFQKSRMMCNKDNRYKEALSKQVITWLDSAHPVAGDTSSGCCFLVMWMKLEWKWICYSKGRGGIAMVIQHHEFGSHPDTAEDTRGCTGTHWDVWLSPANSARCLSFCLTSWNPHQFSVLLHYYYALSQCPIFQTAGKKNIYRS